MRVMLTGEALPCTPIPASGSHPAQWSEQPHRPGFPPPLPRVLASAALTGHLPPSFCLEHRSLSHQKPKRCSGPICPFACCRESLLASLRPRVRKPSCRSPLSVALHRLGTPLDPKLSTRGRPTPATAATAHLYGRAKQPRTSTSYRGVSYNGKREKNGHLFSAAQSRSHRGSGPSSCSRCETMGNTYTLQVTLPQHLVPRRRSWRWWARTAQLTYSRSSGSKVLSVACLENRRTVRVLLMQGACVAG
mmetsp:Transcript_19211/g.32998  ORF Transcript_19211/g.32998 Transcript_19211/m.32998 type:complete len:248 (+) Transcript_19211:224-967(+)